MIYICYIHTERERERVFTELIYYIQVCEKYSQIRMASRTLSGIPLSVLFERIQKEKCLTKESLHIYEGEYDRENLAKCYALLDEIEDLSTNLERCDDKARIYNKCCF